MTQTTTTKTASDLIYLLSCTVNKAAPDRDRCAQMDEEALFELAGRQHLSACAAYSLQKAIPLPMHWLESQAMAVRRMVLFNDAREKILSRMDEEGIRYLPLKGILLKDYYPDPSVREMSDNDILCDPDRMEDVREIMLDLGFSCPRFGKRIHDTYKKPPISFEMHRELFAAYEVPVIAAYYRTIDQKMIPDGDHSSGYHLCDEDCYLYNLCHMYKHYIQSGTGLRSLLDVYVFFQRKGEGLDRAYLGEELKKLGLTEFEEEVLTLAEKLFSSPDAADVSPQELTYYVESGCYGKHSNKVINKLDRQGGKLVRLRYAGKRLFPDKDYLRSYYPVVYRHRALYPLLILYRPIKGLTKKRKRLIKEYKYVKNYKKDKG